jgi:hypothetical protein
MSRKKKSNMRGLAWKKIAEVLVGCPDGLTVKEIQKKTGLSRSTVDDNLRASGEYVASLEGGSDGRVWVLGKTPDKKKSKAVVTPKKKRATRGEAWEKICAVLNKCSQGATFEVLINSTGLPSSTLADNLWDGRGITENDSRRYLREWVSPTTGVSIWSLVLKQEDKGEIDSNDATAEDVASMPARVKELYETYGSLVEQVSRFADVSVRGSQYVGSVMEQMANCVKELKLLREDVGSLRLEVAEFRRELRLTDKIEKLISYAEEPK